MDDFKEGDDHGEEHPDVDHLEVGGHWQSLGMSQVTARKEVQMFDNYLRHLHGGKDEKDGKVYSNDQMVPMTCVHLCF